MLKKRAYALRLVVCVSRFASKPCCAILTKIKLCLCMCVPSCWVISNYFVTPWTVACQAPLFMGFPRQEYWSRLPCPSPWDLPDPGIKPVAPVLAGRLFNTSPRKPNIKLLLYKLPSPQNHPTQDLKILKIVLISHILRSDC